MNSSNSNNKLRDQFWCWIDPDDNNSCAGALHTNNAFDAMNNIWNTDRLQRTNLSICCWSIPREHYLIASGVDLVT